MTKMNNVACLITQCCTYIRTTLEFEEVGEIPTVPKKGGVLHEAVLRHS